MTTSERSLATILFTDIVGSTERTTELGDRQWRQLLEEHHARVRRELRRFGGRELNISGDGFLAVFEGPARAIACADALRQAIRDLNLETRCGGARLPGRISSVEPLLSSWFPVAGLKPADEGKKSSAPVASNDP